MINLEKGQKVRLENDANNGEKLTEIMVGLGWDEKPNLRGGHDYDLDASILMLDANGKLKNGKSVIFYNNKTSECGAIRHQGDNLTGAGEGDDEQILVSLSSLPDWCTKLLIVVDIYQADSRGQKFGDIDNAFVRLVNSSNNSELVKYELDLDSPDAIGLQFATLMKRGSEWIMSADSMAIAGGLGAITRACEPA